MDCKSCEAVGCHAASYQVWLAETRVALFENDEWDRSHSFRAREWWPGLTSWLPVHKWIVPAYPLGERAAGEGSPGPPRIAMSFPCRGWYGCEQSASRMPCPYCADLPDLPVEASLVHPERP